MAMHEIESLVEDSILMFDEMAISTQEKRNAIYHIYKWQNQFDVGYTHFRNQAILEKNHYLFSVPLKEYPNITMDESIRENLPWIDGLEEESLYCTEENGELIAYFDYGYPSWEYFSDKKLIKGGTEKPSEVDDFDLLFSMMEKAIQQNHQDLFCRWFLALIYCINDAYLTLDFITFMEDPRSAKIKEMLLDSEFKTFTNNWGVLTKRSWSGTKILLDTEKDEFFISRFLLDYKVKNETLEKAYKRHKDTPKQDESMLLNQIRAYFSDDYQFAEHEDETGKINWYWYKKANDAHEHDNDFQLQVYIISYYERDGSLFCTPAVQQGVFLRWQNKTPSYLGTDVHFYSSLVENMPENDLENNKYINAFGAWEIKLKQKPKKILKQLDDFCKYLHYAEKYFELCKNNFGGEIAYFKNDLKQLNHLLINGDENHTIPKHILFSTPMSQFLAFMYYNFEQNQETQKSTDLFRAYLEEKPSRIQNKMLPFIEAMEEGKPLTFPIVFTFYNINQYFSE
ncbi:MAG: hypothetical protein ACPGSD_04515 [Flavobacteriales bacterium]